MSLKTELFARLDSVAGVTALIKSGGVTRAYPVRVPQNAAMPAVTFTVISGPRISAFGADTGDVRYRVQIDCWSDKEPGEAKSADAVAAQVRIALQRWSGGNIKAIFFENERDDWDEESKRYVVGFDVIIWYEE